MLSQIIKELERAGGVIDLNELSRRLGVQRSALDGMIETLVRKGRLREVGVGETPPMCASCAERSGCTLVDIGKAYEVVRQE
jgi:DNA-binding Lrp family transcriptional regulator